MDPLLWTVNFISPAAYLFCRLFLAHLTKTFHNVDGCHFNYFLLKPSHLVPRYPYAFCKWIYWKYRLSRIEKLKNSDFFKTSLILIISAIFILATIHTSLRSLQCLQMVSRHNFCNIFFGRGAQWGGKEGDKWCGDWIVTFWNFLKILWCILWIKLFLSI